MQRLKLNRVLVMLGSLATVVGFTGGASAWEALQGAPSAQSTTAAPQSQVAYQTVNTVECVQVPVTQMQTQYRTECRTVDVPVTRMVSEVVNEQRTITHFVPQQKTINKTVTHYVCEPTIVTEKCYRPVPVTKTVQRTLYQTYCTTEIVNKQITRFVPECVTETVPVTKYHKVVEPQLCTVTQRIPTTTMVPVVTCSHACGHRCGGGGCGMCGGVTTCVSYRPVTTCTYQQVQVTRPAVRYVPETTQVTRTRRIMKPVHEMVQVPQVKVNRIPYQVSQCVTVTEMQSYDVTYTKIVRKPVSETVPVSVCVMVPESSTVVVPTVKCRPVTETVSKQVSVCVPYQVPVTVMTTQMRTVAHQVPVTQTATASGQAATSAQAAAASNQ
jgi:hypothetical protein